MLSDEQKALASQIDLESFFDILPDLVCAVTDDGEFLYVNAAWTKSLGWTREELLGRKFADFLHPADLKGSVETFEKRVSQTEVEPFYNRYRTKNGSYRRLAWNAGEHKANGIKYASARDITDDDFTAQQLADVIHASNAGIWRWHVPSGETIFNERWAEMLGYTLDELDRTEIDTWSGLMHPEDLEAADARHQAHFRDETPVYQSENRMRHKDGHWVWVLSRGRVISRLPDGSPEWMTGTHHDITDEKLLEQSTRAAREAAEEANRAKSQFLANMSHEIRTPLNGLLGMAHLMGRTELSDKQALYLKTLKKSGETLRSIIDDVLDISKIEAGFLELDNKPYDLREMLDSAITSVTGTAEIKGLSLKSDIASNLPDTIQGDPGRARQVLLNLLGNAIKFTPSGTITVNARLVESVLTVDVIDTGPGVAEQDRERIFERFAQASEGIARENEGSGLGLAISRQIARMAGGDLFMPEDQPDTGAHFRWTLPLTQDEPADPAETRASPELLGETLKGLRVLLIEDNDVNRQIVREYMEMLGVLLDEADNGQAGQEMIKAQPCYDAIILDLHMPRLTGLDLLRWMEIAYGPNAAPVIVITADASPDVHAELYAAGAKTVLTKPVDLDAAAQAINIAIDRDKA